MRVAILGTGLIGSSIGLRLKRDGKPGAFEIVGFDRYPEVAVAAQKIGAVDTVVETPREAVQGAAIAIIAVPVLAIRVLLEEIAPVVGPDTVITDTGSTKAEVLRWADEYLPGHPGFVGGHPMAGKTETGPGAASPDLFADARWVIVPTVRSSDEAISEVTALAESMGAKPMIMDAAEHDAYVAAISHMPMLAATALFTMMRASEAWPELSMLAAGGFKDMTRLTATDAAMAYDIAVTNREHAGHWLDRYIAALREMRARLTNTETDEDLFKLIAESEYEYTAYRNGKVGREELSTTSEVSSLSFQEMLTGGWVRDKLDEVTKGSEERVREIEARRRDRRDV